MNEKRDYTKIIHRLSRAEGQVRALREALEQDKINDCKQFVTQIRAARSALKGANQQFVTDHIMECQLLKSTERDEKIAEALRIISSD
jgi:DNA-binding FrmR family transcriptional regulator